jgi:hypothetical protein
MNVERTSLCVKSRLTGFAANSSMSDADQYGTGRDDYNSWKIAQVQSDRERQLANVSSGATAGNLQENDYQG